uniref:Uncharacterized protein LOC114346434 n=1 Tax=Diabrotica virgifera virgifera TaxID=50390 RepID=A0A6P7GT35_DIAVI
MVTVHSRSKNPNTSSREPTYLLCITGIDVDYSEEEVTALLTEQEFPVEKLWRVKSYKLGKDSKVIKVVTKSLEKFTTALSRGITLDGEIYNAELPHGSDPTIPTPKYCSKCCINGHSIDECPQKAFVCPHCGGNHKSSPCTKQQEPKCPSCSGDHPAYSNKCPQRHTIPSAPHEIQPLTIERSFPPFELPTETKNILSIQTALLLNLLPELREHIAAITANLISQVYDHSTVVHGYGSNVTVTFRSNH